MPNAVQSEVSVDFTTEIKKTDADYFPVILANNILGGGGQARLFLNLREDKGYTYGSYSSVSTNKYRRSRMRAFASVRNAVTDSSVVELVKEIEKINFYTTYLQKINAVSIEDIQRVTQKYFHLNNARIFVTGKGSEVLENLEKVAPLGKTLPIKFYDKYGVEMDRPDYDSVLPEGIDATSIINAYFDAIGGKNQCTTIFPCR